MNQLNNEIAQCATEKPNEIALAPAGESENSTESASGGLPAAPCSACGGELSFFAFTKPTRKQKAHPALSSGWDDQDFDGVLISQCGDFILIPAQKGYVALRIQKHNYWKIIAETKNLFMMARNYAGIPFELQKAK